MCLFCSFPSSKNSLHAAAKGIAKCLVSAPFPFNRGKEPALPSNKGIVRSVKRLDMPLSCDVSGDGV